MKNHCLSTHSTVDGHLDCCQIEANLNKAANILLHPFLMDKALTYVGCIPRSGIAGHGVPIFPKRLYQVTIIFFEKIKSSFLIFPLVHSLTNREDVLGKAVFKNVALGFPGTLY